MILEFIPDIYKFDEAFQLKGIYLDDIITQLNQECPVNCDFVVGEILEPIGIIYVGTIRLEEGSEPKWLEKTNRIQYNFEKSS